MKHLTIASVLTLLSSACAPVDGVDEPAAETTETVASEIVGGESDHPQAPGYVRLRVSGFICTATVVRPDWLLTTRCIGATTQPSSVRIDMGGLQTPGVEIVRHPTEPIALVRLASTVPFTPRTIGSLTAATLPGTELRCHGNTSANGLSLAGNFIAQSSTGSLHVVRDARRLPNAIYVGDGDVGGPCEVAGGPVNGPVVALLAEPKPTCVSAASCAIDGRVIRVDGVRLWVDDMVRLSRLRGGPRFSLHNLGNNQCWDIPNGSMDEGAAVNQYTCHFNENQDFFTDTVAGVSTHVLLVNARSGKCVEVTAGTSGNRARLRQATCTGGNHQLWQAVPSGNSLMFRPRSEPSRCVDIPDGTWAPPGTQLQISTCHGGANQLWFQAR